MVQNPGQRTLNVGSVESLSLADIACEFSRQAGLGEPRLRPFPPDRKPIDIGSYATCPAACQEELGWRATTSLREGVRKTLDYFREHREQYLSGQTGCSLGHIQRAQCAS
jgi:UDP-glucose 4-epimerase